MYIENKEDNRYWLKEIEKVKQRGLKKVLYISVEENNKKLEQAFKIVYNPYIELIHYESKTRGYEYSKKQEERFEKEANNFKEKWKEVLEKGDPYYNKNFTLKTCNYDINVD